MWTAFMLAAVWAGLALSGCLVEEQAHIAPDYKEEDMRAYLEHRPAGMGADAEGFVEGETGGGSWTQADLDFIYHQTGLGAAAARKIEGKKDRLLRLLEFQRNFFENPRVSCVRDSRICRREQTVDERGAVIKAWKPAELEDGDIIITKASHIFGWRNGHAALVIDAKKGKTLEAVVIGENSAVKNIRKWRKYPDVLILRVASADPETRRKAARWAEANLLNIPYRVTTGLFGSKGKVAPPGGKSSATPPEGKWQALSSSGERQAMPPEERWQALSSSGERQAMPAGGERQATPSEGKWQAFSSSGERQAMPTAEAAAAAEPDPLTVQTVSGTQCAHLIWLAYAQFGYDLDSDGGWIVTPKDLANSPLLEVVQVYGMDPDRPWP